MGEEPTRRLSRCVCMCAQQTALLQTQLADLIGDRSVIGPIKAALPPFNVRGGVVMRAETVKLTRRCSVRDLERDYVGVRGRGDERSRVGARREDPALRAFGVRSEEIEEGAGAVKAAKARADCQSGATLRQWRGWRRLSRRLVRWTCARWAAWRNGDRLWMVMCATWRVGDEHLSCADGVLRL